MARAKKPTPTKPQTRKKTAKRKAASKKKVAKKATKKTAKKATKKKATKKKVAKKPTKKPTKKVTATKKKVTKRKATSQKKEAKKRPDHINTPLVEDGHSEIEDISKIWESAPDVSGVFESPPAAYTRGHSVVPYTGGSPPGLKQYSADDRPARKTAPVIEGADPFEIQAIHEAWASGQAEGRRKIREHVISGAFPNGCILWTNVQAWMRENGWTKLPLEVLKEVVLYARYPDPKKDTQQILALQWPEPPALEYEAPHFEYNPNYGRWISMVLYQLAVHHEMGVLDLIYDIAGKDITKFEPVKTPEPVAVGYVVGKIEKSLKHPPFQVNNKGEMVPIHPMKDKGTCTECDTPDGEIPYHVQRPEEIVASFDTHWACPLCWPQIKRKAEKRKRKAVAHRDPWKSEGETSENGGISV